MDHVALGEDADRAVVVVDHHDGSDAPVVHALRGDRDGLGRLRGHDRARHDVGDGALARCRNVACQACARFYDSAGEPRRRSVWRRGAVPAGALREPDGALERLARGQRGLRVPELDAHRVVERVSPLLVRREPVLAQADAAGARRARARACERGVERAARFGQAVGEAHAQRFVAADTASGEDEIERVRVADQAREPHRAAVDERHAPTPAEHAEHRVARRDPQVAPQRELEPARDRVALDRGDHRLGEQHAGRSHRAVAAVGHRVAAAFADRLQVGARAERAVRAGEDRDRALVVGVERAERVGEQRRGRPVDGVARVRPVDRHDRDRPVVLDDDFAHGLPCGLHALDLGPPSGLQLELSGLRAAPGLRCASSLRLAIDLMPPRDAFTRCSDE